MPKTPTATGHDLQRQRDAGPGEQPRRRDAGRDAHGGGGERRGLFSGLTINKVGSGYTLTAASDSLTAATSASFDVTDQLVVTTQPPSSVAAGPVQSSRHRPRTATEM